MKVRAKSLILLHVLLVVYSFSAVLSKQAASAPFPSFQFFILYTGVLVLLGVYAIGWQQILKRLPLTTAFSNRAIVVLWGILWGLLLFGEAITLNKLIGGVVIMIGVVLFSYADAQQEASATKGGDLS